MKEDRPLNVVWLVLPLLLLTSCTGTPRPAPAVTNASEQVTTPPATVRAAGLDQLLDSVHKSERAQRSRVEDASRALQAAYWSGLDGRTSDEYYALDTFGTMSLGPHYAPALAIPPERFLADFAKSIFDE